MQSSEIRTKFLAFFEAKGHKVLPGSPLVPTDPTVLLTLAGMLQFKPIFLGQEKPAHKRATTVQKCMRMNDVENVGVTPRHHTFFEMLGNFSFGDYFKKEAIQFAWELLTKEFKIPVQRLKIAVYEKDDEAYDIWHKDIGLPKEIIFRLGEDNNFWAVGPTGPCGPCSEIYYDMGEGKGCGKPDCSPGCDCDRFLEVWNLVFISYNRNEKGELVPLKQKGIDTGMGLERITAVLQGVDDNFETDLFAPLMKKVEALRSADSPVSVRIIADHIRAVTHLISDGVFPSNLGRGYVLRRLIRRAISHGKRLGIDKPFLNELSREVIADMKDAYPQLAEKENNIVATIKEEEENFFATLEQGMKWFAETAAKHAEDKLISGAEVFKLHDTYGFPMELTVELAKEKGINIDQAGFEKEMEAQRERARKGQPAEKKTDLTALDLAAYPATNFVGYEKSAEESKVIAVFPSHNVVVLEKTPFYGESGGQAGDTGILAWDKNEIRVVNTYISPRGIVLHVVDELKGLKTDVRVKALIDVSKRKATEAHHTATHLLHRALRDLLGEHVKQAGSYVGPEKLRFDFNHFHAVSLEELQKVEQAVNRKIAEKIKVEVLRKSYKEAVAMGAMALFGEKYGDQVRVLKVDDYSTELCGGTHVKSTGDIQFFKIISEGALGSGVRRLEAIAGQTAKVFVVFKVKSLHDEVEGMIRKYRLLQIEKEQLGGSKGMETNIFEIEPTELERIAKAIDNHDSVNVNKFLDHLYGRVDWLKDRVAKAEKEIEGLKVKKARSEAGSYLSELEEIGGVKSLFKVFKENNMDVLRTVSDTVQEQLKSCVLVLASTWPGRLVYLITVTPDLVEKGLSAKKLADVFSGLVGGKGGGKETKVEGGGKDPTRIKAGFEAIRKLIT
ncbi:MAG: alanine--tRNA ligase [Candidatus Margulisbacteria bacterium]|nr:alanine--tRNA ligase [Candidatus Margulisiibacteriota bacterium]